MRNNSLVMGWFVTMARSFLLTQESPAIPFQDTASITGDGSREPGWNLAAAFLLSLAIIAKFQLEAG
jgi:hypothetical protein